MNSLHSNDNRAGRGMAGIFAALGLSLLLSPAAAQADPFNFFNPSNQRLQGDYAFTGEASCLYSESGFDPTTLSPVLPPNPGTPLPFVVSFSIEGIRTFNGDGTGSLKGRVVSFTPLLFGWTNNAGVLTQGKEVNPGGASSADVMADFTYQIADDGSITSEVSGAFTGTVLTGGRAGESETISDFPDLMGKITDDNKVITLANDAPSVETHVFTPTAAGQPPALTEYAICNRSRTLFKLDDHGQGHPFP